MYGAAALPTIEDDSSFSMTITKACEKFGREPIEVGVGVGLGVGVGVGVTVGIGVAVGVGPGFG